MTTPLFLAEDRVKSGIHVRAIEAQKSPPGTLRCGTHDSHPPNTNDDSSHWLTVSPYLEPEHLLDLRSVDTPNRLLALASVQLAPATGDYATVNYGDALDWISLMSSLKAVAAAEGYRWTRHAFYVVEFRSKLKQNIDNDLLFKLDKESHAEATKSGGLLKYWYGVPDTERRNLATCKWFEILSYYP